MAPALAVADALRAEGAKVEFIGGQRAEAQLVPDAGYPLHAIAVEGLSRTSIKDASLALVRSVDALRRSYALLGELAPDAVMGGGGYVSGPVGLAAVLRRTPLVLTEADSHLGLSNRVLAPFARRVCLAFPPYTGGGDRGAPRGRQRGMSRNRRRGARYIVTGRPLPHPRRDRAQARERFGIEGEELCVLVFGGSLGAHSINIAAVEALHPQGFYVLHVCGRRDHPELAARALPRGYDLREYLDLEAFADALAAADLVVSRAGGSVFEIAAYGLPAILVPYPHAAGDHQSSNARWMADAGAAIVIPDHELTPARLAREVAQLLSSPARLAAMASASARIARPDAAERVARELLAAAGR